MYKSFYKLQSSPFNTSPDPRFLYMMPHTREALAGLEYGISARKGFIVLVGEVGTGKTTFWTSSNLFSATLALRRPRGPSRACSSSSTAG